MMRRLFLVSTAAFWLALLGLWLLLAGQPDQDADPLLLAATERRIGMDEVAKHRSATDCWLVIDGVVFDVSSYFPNHPADPGVLLAWCGKEATQAYRTKMQGRPHSPASDRMLPRYRIGLLQDAGTQTPR